MHAAIRRINTDWLSVEERRQWLELKRPQLSLARQCELLALPRSTAFYQPVGESAEYLALMRRIDEQHLATPFYGNQRTAEALGSNRKRMLAQ